MITDFLLSVIASSVLAVAITTVWGLFVKPKYGRFGNPPSARYTAEILPPASFTADLPIPQISAVEPPRTYKRLVGRRVTEFDAETNRRIG